MTTSLADAINSALVFTDGDWVESKDQDPNGDVRLVQLADVGDGFFVDKSARFLTSTKARQLRCTYLEPGDILIARMPDPLGRACIYPGGTMPSVTVVDVCILRVDPTCQDPRWFMHLLNGDGCRREMASYATGTTRSRISRSNLAKIKVSVPPIEEQRRIAAVLDKADELRAKRRAALAQLDGLTESILERLLQDKNAHEWPVATIGDLGVVQGGLQVTRTRSSNPISVPYLRVANVHRGRLDTTDIKQIRVTAPELERARLRTDDLLVVEGHGNAGEIGRVARWSGEIDDCVHQNHLIRVRVSRDLALPRFVERYLNCRVGRRALLRAARTTSGLNTISTSDVRDVALPVPPLGLQAQFEHQLDCVAAMMRRQKNDSADLDDLFASLQQRAFRGEL